MLHQLEIIFGLALLTTVSSHKEITYRTCLSNMNSSQQYGCYNVYAIGSVERLIASDACMQSWNACESGFMEVVNMSFTTGESCKMIEWTWACATPVHITEMFQPDYYTIFNPYYISLVVENSVLCMFMLWLVWHQSGSSSADDKSDDNSNINENVEDEDGDCDSDGDDDEEDETGSPSNTIRNDSSGYPSWLTLET
jgi:hypothetical protein